MLKPRNTLVVVAPLEKKETKIGNLVIPYETGRQYQLCEVVEIGPGMVTQPNELSSTRDLAVEQTVLVKTRSKRLIAADRGVLDAIGVDFTTEDGRALTLVEETQIVAIVA